MNYLGANICSFPAVVTAGYGWRQEHDHLPLDVPWIFPPPCQRRRSLHGDREDSLPVSGQVRPGQVNSDSRRKEKELFFAIAMGLHFPMYMYSVLS